MKQTSKLTRRQRQFLEENGVKVTNNLRFCEETDKKFVYYDTSKEKQVVILK